MSITVMQVSSEDSSPFMTSISGIMCGGFHQCMPANRSGFETWREFTLATSYFTKGIDGFQICDYLGEDNYEIHNFQKGFGKLSYSVSMGAQCNPEAELVSGKFIRL